MDHNSQADSSITREASDGWGSMGGGPGDGIMTSPQSITSNTAIPNVILTTSGAPGMSPPGDQYPPHQQQQQQHQQYVMGYGTPQTPQQSAQQQPQYPSYTPGSGSITRFATPPEVPQQPQFSHPYHGGGASVLVNQAGGVAPASSDPPGSYAARSAQVYAAVNYQQPSPPVGMPPPPPSQQQQQQHHQMQQPGSYAARSAQAYATGQGMQQQQSSNNFFGNNMVNTNKTGVASPNRGAGGGVTPVGSSSTSGGSFAERSAQAYAAQQQQQYQQHQPVTYNNNNTPGVYAGYPDPNSTAVHPYAATGAPPAPSTTMGSNPSSYAARSAQAYGGTPAAVSNQAVPPVPQMTRPMGPATVSSATPPGSYTARAAQAYGMSQQQQQQQYQGMSQQQQQQQPVVTPSSMGGGVGPYSVQPQNYSPTPNQQYPQHMQQAMLGQQQQHPGMMPPAVGQPGMVMPMNIPPGGGNVQSMAGGGGNSVMGTASLGGHDLSSQIQAVQQRLLTDATRKIQEHAYYMRQAMQQNNLPVVLDRAAYMVGELGGLPHGHHQQQQQQQQQQQAGGTSTGLTNSGASSKLTPKNYYELYMRALEDLPHLEDYLLNVTRGPVIPPNSIQIVESRQQVHHRKPFTMRELYDAVQYCPRVLSRLYLQITAGSALIRSGEASARWVMNDLVESVRCEQNPIRGLFLRHYLLTALRDKLPDTPPPAAAAAAAAASLSGTPIAATSEVIENNGEMKSESQVHEEDEEKEPGTVKDSYKFILANFMEMNKLWVRIQHLPGEGQNKEAKKRRERERNELRILVGTNLVRLSQLECVTSKIYGEDILQQILDHIVTCGDPLSQAYLMDCLVQAFPDEYHIETLPILLNVCPRLRDKVNIRTILQGLMDRLANYLAEDELLDESDTNQVKKELARDSFGLFEVCVQNVYNGRGPKLTSREVIRLQTALLQFSVKCYPGNLVQIGRCVGVCVSALRQAAASYEIPDGTIATVPQDKLTIKALDDVAVAELEKLLSIPLDTLALQCLNIEHYGDLIGFLPWSNRRGLAITILKSVEKTGSIPTSVKELDELFTVIEPVLRDNPTGIRSESAIGLPNNSSGFVGGLHMTPAGSYGGPVGEPHLPNMKAVEEENSMLSKLVHMVNHEDNYTLFEFLNLAQKHIRKGELYRRSQTCIALVFAYLRLARRVLDKNRDLQTPTREADVKRKANDDNDYKVESEKDGNNMGHSEPESLVREDVDSLLTSGAEPKPVETDAKEIEMLKPDADSKTAEPELVSNGSGAPDDATVLTITCRQVFVVIQETIADIVSGNAERGFKIYLEVALTADVFAGLMDSSSTEFSSIAHEFLTQALALYEEAISDARSQQRCIVSLVGALLQSKSINHHDYEILVTRTTQFAAKSHKKSDQCQLVAVCAHLFYPVGAVDKYSNPQRSLECLQRSLKLADSCTVANPSDIYLFVELLEHYLFFFEKMNPAITPAYIGGLVALIKEHFAGRVGTDVVMMEAKEQFLETVRYIKLMKSNEESAEHFAAVQIDVSGV